MSAEVDHPLTLTKVDSASAVEAGDASPKMQQQHQRRRSSTVSIPGVFKIEELEKEGTALEIAPETQKLGWKLNTSPSTVEEKDYLKLLLVTPPIKKIDLHFPLGLEVTARNPRGVTIKDALDAIHKQFKKKDDDEMGDKPYLAGFEWNRKECYTRFVVHQKQTGNPVQSGHSKKKSKNQNKIDE